jgi:lipopolysaccharide export system protein LptC
VNRLTAAYSTNHNENRGFTAAERPSGDLVFRRARRHSRRMRLLRILIPVVLAAGLVVSTLVVWFNPLRLLSELPVSIGRLTVSGTKMTMTKPKLSGYTRDERRYELTANAAAQDMTNVDVVNLEEPRASLEMADGNTIKMRAVLGVFDRKEGVLTLSREIVITSTGGIDVRLDQAVIDVRNGNIVSDQPVNVKMPQGTLSGNRLEVIKSGEIVRFDGGVTMVLDPQNALAGEKKKTLP